jgi:predicted AlkP superfamily phosphohydrolase/phosphomutase
MLTQLQGVALRALNTGYAPGSTGILLYCLRRGQEHGDRIG